jgi:hypothetical protein
MAKTFKNKLFQNRKMTPNIFSQTIENYVFKVQRIGANHILRTVDYQIIRLLK